MPRWAPSGPGPGSAGSGGRCPGTRLESDMGNLGDAENTGKPHPEPSWFLFRPFPAYFLRDKTREPVLPRLCSLRLLCPWARRHIHRYIRMYRDVWMCTAGTASEQGAERSGHSRRTGRAGPSRAGQGKLQVPAPSEQQLWPSPLNPRAKGPPPGGDFSLANISQGRGAREKERAFWPLFPAPCACR